MHQRLNYLAYQGALAGLVLSGVTASAHAKSEQELEESVGTIVVTARKRAESIQDVPISISVLSSEDLEQSGAIKISEALGSLPNVNYEADSLAGGPINIRGVSASSNNFGIESPVGVYVDEVYLARPSAFDQSALDIERVEVLRGPQGTLFGRNTIAGVLNITTAPTATYLEAQADVTYGEYDLRQVRLAVSGPIADGVGGRLSFSRGLRDGWFKQKTPGSPDFNNLDTTTGRAKLSLTPSDRFDAVLTLDYAKDRSVSGNNKVVAGPLKAFDNFDQDEIATNIPGRESREFKMASLRMNQDLDGHSLTSITAFQKIEYNRFNDQDYTVLDILATGSQEKDDQFSQELRLSSTNDSTFDYVLGAYYSDGLVSGQTRAVLGTDVPAALGLPIIPGYTESVDTNARISSRTFAVFASTTYEIDTHWVASLGLRYTDEHRALRYGQVVTPFFLAPGVPVGVIYGLAADVPTLRQEVNDNAITGDGTLTYRWSSDISNYIRFSRGYKGGGFETTPAVSSDPGALSFDPEYVNLYEAGFKSTFANRQVRLNASVFYMDYTDKQEQVFNGTSFATSNAAEATLKGAEVELTVSTSRALSLSLSGGYTDAVYGRYVDPLAGVDNSGNRLPGSARWSGSLAADYNTPIGTNWRLTMHAEANYRSGSFSTPDNNPAFASSARTLVNARIGIAQQDDRYGIYLWGRNITNKRYLLGGFDFLGSTFVNRNRPATWGLEFRAKY